MTDEQEAFLDWLDRVDTGKISALRSIWGASDSTVMTFMQWLRELTCINISDIDAKEIERIEHDKQS